MSERDRSQFLSYRACLEKQGECHSEHVWEIMEHVWVSAIGYMEEKYCTPIKCPGCDGNGCCVESNMPGSQCCACKGTGKIVREEL